MTLEELAAAIKSGAIDPKTLQAHADSYDLHVYAADGEHLFSGMVGPREVALALGIEDVSNV